jgi:hypothetical protein
LSTRIFLRIAASGAHTEADSTAARGHVEIHRRRRLRRFGGSGSVVHHSGRDVWLHRLIGSAMQPVCRTGRRSDLTNDPPARIIT